MEVARERVRGGRPLPGARAVQPRRELRVAPHQAPAARAHRRREVRLQRALRPARLAGGRGLRPGVAPAHRPCSVAQVQLVGGWWYNVIQRSQDLPAELHSATHGLRGHAITAAAPSFQRREHRSIACRTSIMAAPRSRR